MDFEQELDKEEVEIEVLDEQEQVENFHARRESLVYRMGVGEHN